MAKLAEAAALPADVAPLVDAAREAERIGRYDEARELYESALLRLTDPASTPAVAASLYRWIGNSHRTEGNAEEAMDCYQASLAIAELNDDSANVAHALNAMGTVLQEWGDLGAALKRYRMARRLATDAGEARLIAMVDQNMGVVANIQGDLQRARDHYERSLEGYRALGEEAYIAMVLNNLGMLHTDLGEWAEAERHLDESAALCERLGDDHTLILVEGNRAELYYHMGDLDRARAACDAAFALADRLDRPAALGPVFMWYGIFDRESGELSQAEEYLLAAAEIAERYANPLLVGEVQRELAMVYRAQERNGEALRALTYAHRVFQELRASLDLADVGNRIQELEELYLQVVRMWGESIESKDHYTAGHCQRVADYSCMLARRLGFDDQTLTWFRMGAFLHDVGKVVVPAEILNKTGELTEEEWAIMRTHTTAGAELLSRIDFPWDLRPMVRSHHEHWDGTGYPDGLKERMIPLSARILCVADVFDALTSTRAYRAAHSPEEALRIMERDVGRIFDPELFALFRELILERLRDGTLHSGG